MYFGTFMNYKISVFYFFNHSCYKCVNWQTNRQTRSGIKLSYRDINTHVYVYNAPATTYFLYKEKCTVENYICFKSCELRNFNCMYIPNKHTREFVLKT